MKLAMELCRDILWLVEVVEAEVGVLIE